MRDFLILFCPWCKWKDSYWAFRRTESEVHDFECGCCGYLFDED